MKFFELFRVTFIDSWVAFIDPQKKLPIEKKLMNEKSRKTVAEDLFHFFILLCYKAKDKACFFSFATRKDQIENWN